MIKLTAEKAEELAFKLESLGDDISIKEELYRQALRIAAGNLRAEEKSGLKIVITGENGQLNPNIIAAIKGNHPSSLGGARGKN